MGRRRILNKPLYLCLICGDRAKGKNFGVLACPACTAFFRFSIVNDKSYECKLSGNCQINVSLKRRCICRFCRLQKCLRLGMDIDLVQNRKISASTENTENLKSERETKIIENGVEEEINNKFEHENLQIEQTDLLLFGGDDCSIGGLGEVEKLMRKCRQGRDWMECFRECRLEEENGCLEDLLENREVLARLLDWSRKKPKDNEFAKTWTKKMYLGAADLLGTSPIIHSDFWLSEQLLCAEFLKKMPKFNELATEDKLKQYRLSMMTAILFSSAFYSQQEGMQHLVGNKGISPHWAYDIDMYANDPNVAHMSKEIYVDFVSKLARIQLTALEFTLLLAMVFYEAACSDISEPARHLMQSERQKLAGHLMRLQHHKFGSDIAVCRHMDCMNLLSTAAQTALQQERLEIHVDLFYFKGLRQKPVPMAFQPRAISQRRTGPNSWSGHTKLYENIGIAHSDWSPATMQPYEWSPPSSQMPPTQPEFDNDQQQQQQQQNPASNQHIQMAQQHGNNFCSDKDAAAGFGHLFSSWDMRPSAAAEESMHQVGHYVDNNDWKSQQHPVLHHDQNDFAGLFEEANGENYFFDNQSTNFEFLC